MTYESNLSQLNALLENLRETIIGEKLYRTAASTLGTNVTAFMGLIEELNETGLGNDIQTQIQNSNGLTLLFYQTASDVALLCMEGYKTDKTDKALSEIECIVNGISESIVEEPE